MFTVSFITPEGALWVFNNLPAVPSVGHTVVMAKEARKVMRVVWDLQAAREDDRIQVYLGELR